MGKTFRKSVSSRQLVLISPHAFDGPPLFPHRSPGGQLDKGFLDVPERNGPGSPNQSSAAFVLELEAEAQLHKRIKHAQSNGHT